MGLLDDLKKLLGSAGDKASKEAGKLAARQALSSVKDKVDELGEDLLGTAQKELDEARRVREGRPEYGPSEGDSGDIAARIEAAARAAEERDHARRRQAPPPPEDEAGLIGTDPPADDPEARARRELERLKASLRADKDAPPAKRTL